VNVEFGLLTQKREKAMEVILLEKVQNLGSLGDKVSVKSGYGRNYLIPSKMAVAATPENVARFEEKRAELEAAQEDALGKAQRRAEQLNELSVTIASNAGSEGKLFGSVGTADIAAVITESGVEVEKKEIRLPTGALREVGEYDVEIHLHPDVNQTVNIVIVAEES